MPDKKGPMANVKARTYKTVTKLGTCVTLALHSIPEATVLGDPFLRDSVT